MPSKSKSHQVPKAWRQAATQERFHFHRLSFDFPLGSGPGEAAVGGARTAQPAPRRRSHPTNLAAELSNFLELVSKRKRKTGNVQLCSTFRTRGQGPKTSPLPPLAASVGAQRPSAAVTERLAAAAHLFLPLDASAASRTQTEERLNG